MNSSLAGSPVEILLVEDNPGDVRLTRRAIERASVDCDLKAINNGRLALAYLQREAPYGDARRPDLVLLDLNLPGMKGDEVLRAMKSDDSLRNIPVIVLSSSRNPEDIASSYRGYANCYVRKPSDIDGFNDVMRRLGEFWFATAELPEG